ncbi:MAG: hypothetical protein Q4B01_00245 [Eubacteriales bacterium]|nr:hypothetical protein [Eubacteriales bacterium]
MKKNKWTNNLQLKLLSMVAACFIWVFVMQSNNPERTKAVRNVPITMLNQNTITDANKTFTVVDSVNKATVYVTARRTVRDRLTAANFTITADMENYNEVTGSVPLEITCTDNSIFSENIRVNPSALKINMEDKVEESFSIAVSASGKAAKGYELGKTTILTGDTIRIAGPESLIGIIGKVTIPVDISGMTVDSNGLYAIRIEDKNGSVLTDAQMSNLELKDNDGVVLQKGMADVAIEIWSVYEGITLNLSMRGEPAEGYEVSSVTLTPKTVNLVGDELALEEIGRELTLKDTISVEGISESQEFVLDLNETLALYKNLRLEADTSSTVTVLINVQELGSQNFEVPISDIQMDHVPRDKKLIFSPADKISVTVHAEEQELEQLRTSEIKAWVDLSECTENGSYTLPVKITLPENYEQIGEVKLVVNVEDVENELEAEALTED